MDPVTRRRQRHWRPAAAHPARRGRAGAPAVALRSRGRHRLPSRRSAPRRRELGHRDAERRQLASHDWHRPVCRRPSRRRDARARPRRRPEPARREPRTDVRSRPRWRSAPRAGSSHIATTRTDRTSSGPTTTTIAVAAAKPKVGKSPMRQHVTTSTGNQSDSAAAPGRTCASQDEQGDDHVARQVEATADDRVDDDDERERQQPDEHRLPPAARPPEHRCRAPPRRVASTPGAGRSNHSGQPGHDRPGDEEERHRPADGSCLPGSLGLSSATFQLWPRSLNEAYLRRDVAVSQ